MTHLVFALDDNHDMCRSISSIKLLRDSDAILQTVKTRLLLHYEEWFLDLNAGIPYFQLILVNNPNLVEIESIIGREIALTDGVDRVLNIALSFRPEDRSLAVDFSYIDVYGRQIEGNI